MPTTDREEGCRKVRETMIVVGVKVRRVKHEGALRPRIVKESGSGYLNVSEGGTHDKREIVKEGGAI